MGKSDVFWMLLLLQFSTGSTVDVPSIELECITPSQLLRATQILCVDQRHNKAAWNTVIRCHRPISNQFLRSAGAANCPNPKYVQNPKDIRYSIQEVFFNICGIVQGNATQIAEGFECMSTGTDCIMSHEEEVKQVKRRWGDDTLCNIAKCILKMGLV